MKYNPYQIRGIMVICMLDFCILEVLDVLVKLIGYLFQTWFCNQRTYENMLLLACVASFSNHTSLLVTTAASR